jgi:hypothetical protein
MSRVGLPVRIPRVTPMGMSTKGRTKKGAIIHAAFFTPYRMGSVSHPSARSPSMSAKSLVEAAPSRKSPKMDPMYQGSSPTIVFTVDQPATFSSTPRGMAMVTLAQMP